MKPGVLLAFSAYVLWGLFPLYFSRLHDVSSYDVLVHRVVWSGVCIAIALAATRRWRWIGGFVANPRLVGRYATGAVLIAINWFVYIASVQHGHVVDASLGYFITPLFSVLLARLLLAERPRPAQWIAIAIAASGVLWLGIQAGHVPWVGLVLAASFSGYGLAKKTSTLGALEGLAAETALLLPIAVASFVWLATQGRDAMTTGEPLIAALLIASGPLTVLALLLFAAGARRIPLSTLGLLQYVTPTLQMLIGVFVLGEDLGASALLGYMLIWSALAIYAAEGAWWSRRRAAARPMQNVPDPAHAGSGTPEPRTG